MTEHTPGPWTVGDGHATAHNHAVCAGPQIIAKVTALGYPAGFGWSEVSEANAHLIAAAPDLLAALEGLLHETEQAGNANADDYGWPTVVPQARAAIAKARNQ